jgi:hypothetical protein
MVISSIYRNSSIPGKETFSITHDLGASNPILVYITDVDDVIHVGNVVSRASGSLEIREIPYYEKRYSVKIFYNGTLSDAITYTPEQTPLSGLSIFDTFNVNHSKSDKILANTSLIKGGIQPFDDLYDFLYMPKSVMSRGMLASVVHQGSARVYVLKESPENLPFPLENSDAGLLNSFRTYWNVVSITQAENLFNTTVQYAPSFNGGMPPFYENLSGAGSFNRYIFPEGLEWDDERAFTTTLWDDVKNMDSRWKRYYDETLSSFSRPIPIDSDEATFRTIDTRFIRHYRKPGEEGSPIPVQSFFGGESNPYGFFNWEGLTYEFLDGQPPTRIWDELPQAEQVSYETRYGSVVDKDEPELLIRINNLWFINCYKDVYGNMHSAWSDPELLPEGNGDLVRYSTNGNGDINGERIKLIEDDIADANLVNAAYIKIGWVTYQQQGVHNYMAYRSDTISAWSKRQITNEIGDYVKDFYKLYPINYYDRIMNISTAAYFLPVGVNATNNPGDDITQFFWTDAPPTEIAKGFELYRATGTMSYDKLRLLTPFVVKLTSGRSPVVDFILADYQNFVSKIDDTADTQPPVETREHDSILLKSNITVSGEDISELPDENIFYVWKKTYNAGAPTSEIIYNNFGKTLEGNTYTDTPDTVVPEDALDTGAKAGYIISEDGKNLTIEHTVVVSSAVFVCEQYRDVSGNSDFEDTGRNYIKYISEITIGDLVDRKIVSLVVTSETNQFTVDPLHGDTLTKDNFTGPRSINIRAFGTNIDYSEGNWYRWKTEDYDYENIKETASAEAWGAIEIEVDTHWVSLDKSDSFHTISWNSDGFDNASLRYNVYKFQLTAPSGAIVYDYITISKIAEGKSSQDIAMKPGSFAIPLNLATTGFDGTNTRKKFVVSSFNIGAPSYSWVLRNKNNDELATVVGTSFTFQADQSQFDATIDTYSPTSTSNIIANAPYTLTVIEDSTTLFEESLIGVIIAGSSAVKGEEGTAGISVIYDPNDLIPTDEYGVPNKTVNEFTEVKIFRGTVLQAAGAGAEEFSLEVIQADLPTEVTATDDGLSIRVTSVPGGFDVLPITFKIFKNADKPVVDVNDDPVIFIYKLVKAVAGGNPVVMNLDNEASIIHIASNGNDFVTQVVNSSLNYVASTTVSVKKGVLDLTSSFVRGLEVYFNDEKLKIVTGGSSYLIYGEYTGGPTRGALMVYLNVLNASFYVYVNFASDALSVPEFLKVTIKYEDATTGLILSKSLSLKKLVASQEIRTIQIIPVSGTSFRSDAINEDELFFNIKFFEGKDPDPVNAWTTPTVTVGVNPNNSLYDAGTKVLTVKKVDITSQNLAVTIYSGGTSAFVQIVNQEAGEGIQTLYFEGEVLTHTATSQTLPDRFVLLGAPYIETATYDVVKALGATGEITSNNMLWKKSSQNAVWACYSHRSEGYWRAPFRLKGEKGTTGKSFVTVRAYKFATTAPATPTGTVVPPPGDWHITPFESDTWVSEILLEKTSTEYVLVDGSSWSTPVRLSGIAGLSVKMLYRKHVQSTMDQNLKPQSASETDNWKDSPQRTGPATSDNIFFSFGYFDNNSILIGAFSDPAIFRFPQATDGDSIIGPMPDHKWVADGLSFQKPGGGYGPEVYLRGNTGLTGPMPGHKWFGSYLSIENESGDFEDPEDLLGPRGWTPLIVLEFVDGLGYFKLLDYVGGIIAKPTIHIGQYMTTSGYVDTPSPEFSISRTTPTEYVYKITENPSGTTDVTVDDFYLPTAVDHLIQFLHEAYPGSEGNIHNVTYYGNVAPPEAGQPWVNISDDVDLGRYVSVYPYYRIIYNTGGNYYSLYKVLTAIQVLT